MEEQRDLRRPIDELLICGCLFFALEATQREGVLSDSKKVDSSAAIARAGFEFHDRAIQWFDETALWAVILQVLDHLNGFVHAVLLAAQGGLEQVLE